MTAPATTMRLVDGDLELPFRMARGNDGSPITCTSYDLGFPDVREVVSDRSGQSGQDDDTQWFGSRTVIVNVTVRDGALDGWDVTSRHQWLDQLRAFSRPSRRPYLYLWAQGWEQERRLKLRATPFSCSVDNKGGVIIPATLTYKVPSGTMEAVQATTGTLYPMAASAGMHFPMSFPMSFAPGAAPNSAILTNAGTETAYPLFRVYGQGTNPVITKKATGEQVALTTPVASGHYVDINMADHTVYLDSDPSLSLYGNLDLSRTTWWGLDPGDNEVAFTVGNIDNSCQLYFEYASEWI